MSGRYAAAEFERRTREILAGAPIVDLGEICRFCADRVVRGELYCKEHLTAVRSTRTEMERC